MVFLGVKSQIDDKEGSTAQQLTQQHEDEMAYSATPFEPYTKVPEGASSGAAIAQVVDPLVSKGKGIFNDRGCSACHGDNGTGTALAPSLVGIAKKLPSDRLVALLQNPNARMKAGGMPTVDASPEELTALVAYLRTLGKSAGNSSTTYSLAPNLLGHGVKEGNRALIATAADPSLKQVRSLSAIVLPVLVVDRRPH
jgi:mono/diheme cytochrome c family protein